jgi:alpha-1,3-rhamnosyltransferase
MKSNTPLVSVIIPAYNHALYVERAISSVLNQTYKNIELIVIDDGSIDDTWNEINRIHQKSGGKFKIFTQSNKGVSITLNLGVAKSSGIYIALLASDDYYVEDKIERQVKLFLESHDTVGLVHSSAFMDYGDPESIVSLTGSYIPAVGDNIFYMLVEQGARVVAPTVMFKRIAYDSVQGFDENLIAEDVDFYVALAAKGWSFGYDSKPLVYKTEVEGSLGSRIEVLHDVHFQILNKYKNIIKPEKFENLTNSIYKHIIILAAGNNELNYAFRITRILTKKLKNLLSLYVFVVYAIRNITLRSIPFSVRKKLRLLRSKYYYSRKNIL